MPEPMCLRVHGKLIFLNGGLLSVQHSSRMPSKAKISFSLGVTAAAEVVLTILTTGYRM